jgi:L-ornithine N5-monooxygenase
MTIAEQPVHDLVGIGFGPSNLALAIALRERHARTGERIDAVFLEKQPSFGWHRGMLLEDTTMQVSFLKDLVTMRNPASEFSFLCYLKARGRMLDFINHKTMFPSRLEFHDYLEWAAASFADQVEYGSEVVAVTPVTVDGAVEYLDVVVRQGEGELSTRRTRNLVVAVGLDPVLPDGVVGDERIWHSKEFMDRLPSVTDPRRFVVVGAGQSAAEVIDHLHGRFPGAEVCAVFSKYGYTPADDSSFANRIFDPSAVDDFYGAPEPVKKSLLAYHGNTNYSVVDNDLIQELYRRSYQEKVQGRERLRIMNASRVAGFDRRADGVRIRVDHLATGGQSELDCDALIFATGYRPPDLAPILQELAVSCETDEQGRLRIGRDYRLLTDSSTRCGIYLQGGTEHTHGLSSSLLSNAAIRAGEIVRSVALHRQALDREQVNA